MANVRFLIFFFFNIILPKTTFVQIGLRLIRRVIITQLFRQLKYFGTSRLYYYNILKYLRVIMYCEQSKNIPDFEDISRYPPQSGVDQFDI